MTKLDYHDAQNVSDNIIATHQALDEALLKFSALTESMICASRTANMPAAESQKALEAVTDGISGLMASRRGFVSAHKHMIIVRNHSNHQVTDFGCLSGDGPVKGKSPLRVAA
ncbi:hypothetical protein ACFOWX_02285 [Sphingorhabdus arenilitoris]|uniref:Uncharacterized protein n=1 Tax=Sphingorhabdus arenilitoris TaxID=1490041 RepID=A0ABV8RG38_9SPHN